VADIVLPKLVQRSSPNRSSRHGARVDLLVWHESAGRYAARASAHIVLREDGNEATQLVPLGLKAWHAADYNARSVGVEHSDRLARGYSTLHQLEVSARVFGWLCLHLGVPPVWAKGGRGRGVCYHGELGAAGGGHTSCGPDQTGWILFLDFLHAEMQRGGFRKAWAK
jgi:hypothetical protein